jgi:hypothetical protein
MGLRMRKQAQQDPSPAKPRSSCAQVPAPVPLPRAHAIFLLSFSRYPRATYGGDAPAIGQSRLGQALPGEGSARVRWRPVQQQIRTSSPRPATHTPSFSQRARPSPATQRHELTRERACDPWWRRSGSKKRARLEPPQEATSHAGSDLTRSHFLPQEAGLHCVATGVSRDYISRNAFRCGVWALR